MKTTINLILVLCIAAGALYATNPDQEAFGLFLSDYVQTELADDTPGETALGQKLRKGLGDLAAVAGREVTEREDFYVASIYRLDILNKHYTFAGVAGQFFLVEKTEE